MANRTRRRIRRAAGLTRVRVHQGDGRGERRGGGEDKYGAVRRPLGPQRAGAWRRWRATAAKPCFEVGDARVGLPPGGSRLLRVSSRGHLGGMSCTRSPRRATPAGMTSAESGCRLPGGLLSCGSGPAPTRWPEAGCRTRTASRSSPARRARFGSTARVREMELGGLELPTSWVRSKALGVRMWRFCRKSGAQSSERTGRNSSAVCGTSRELARGDIRVANSEGNRETRRAAG
jgi:hypothetical protein